MTLGDLGDLATIVIAGFGMGTAIATILTAIANRNLVEIHRTQFLAEQRPRIKLDWDYHPPKLISVAASFDTVPVVIHRATFSIKRHDQGPQWQHMTPRYTNDTIEENLSVHLGFFKIEADESIIPITATITMSTEGIPNTTETWAFEYQLVLIDDLPKKGIHANRIGKKRLDNRSRYQRIKDHWHQKKKEMELG